MMKTICPYFYAVLDFVSWPHVNLQVAKPHLVRKDTALSDLKIHEEKIGAVRIEMAMLPTRGQEVLPGERVRRAQHGSIF
jgi:hypothetical protein